LIVNGARRCRRHRAGHRIARHAAAPERGRRAPLYVSLILGTSTLAALHDLNLAHCDRLYVCRPGR
jgi:hypothetical protein